MFSPFGDACAITSPGAAKIEVKGESVSKVDFSAVAYPNPFAEHFMIDVKTASEAAIGIKVYDMTGRLLEQREVQVSEMESQQVGESYPAGVYNVIESQGHEVKTLRVIKR